MFTTRFKIQPETELIVFGKFKSTLEKEIARKGDAAFISRHEILKAITEEFNGLVEAVKSNDIERLKEELLDVMISSFWGLCSIESRSLE